MVGKKPYVTQIIPEDIHTAFAFADPGDDAGTRLDPLDSWHAEDSQ